MHGVEETSMTGARGTQVVNGSTAPPAATQVGSPIVATKVINKTGVISPPTSSGASGSLTLCQQQGAIINIMSRPGTVATATPNGTPASVPLQPGMQIVNMRPNQGIQMAAGRSLPPRMIVNQIPNVRPGQTGQQLTLQTLPGLPPGTQGHLIVKTDNGQFQLVRVNAAPATPGQIPPNGTPTTATTMVVHQATNNTYRFQQPQTSGTIASLANSTSVAPQMVTAGGQTVVVPASAVTVPATSTMAVGSAAVAVTTTAATVVTANNVQTVQTPPTVGTQTISAESAKTKCKNFLATLLRLAGEQRVKVAQNVRSLIQGLIDGKVEPEAFTEDLQKDLNSSPQPCLVPFLKKTLPYLRASLAKGELEIHGVRPPPLSAVAPVTGMTTVIPSMVGIVRPTTPTPAGALRVVTPTPGGPTFVHRPAITSNVGAQATTPTTARVVTQVQQMRVANKTLVTAVRPSVPPIGTSTPGTLTTSSITQPATTSTITPHSIATSTSAANSGSAVPTTSSTKSTVSKAITKEEKKSKDKSSGGIAFNSYTSSVGDDDINDVAAMGGVNLGEESQRILDSTGFVGRHIRSCKDEVFLVATPLTQRIKQIASENNLEEPSKEVVSLISHAVQERLKTLVEKLGVIAEHRLDIIRAEPRYEVVQDVKGQLRFLEELDKLEKKRKDEQEREMLLRAAKSRSKSEDPEQAKLKAKAKEMQRAEMEEMRQRDANLTALKALQGPRKKPKLDVASEENSTFSGTFTQKQMPLRPRIKRVNLRDMLFLMEQEKDLHMSHTLYRTYLK